ncbi:MAG: hypothetical protein KAT71_08215 [Gammaproteobacteria bacterium]|nr:hypothetical protein [Gammaproteobacteria bacterium]
MNRVLYTVKFTWGKGGQEHTRTVSGRTLKAVVRKAKVPKKVDYRYNELLSKEKL